MTLFTSLYSGTSGLAANSLELGVVGDNLANANTIGFKLGRAAFEDALSQNMLGGAGQLGLGTRLSAIQQLVTQGALANTGVSTDVAISGPGYFTLRGSHNGRDGTYYSRAGQLTVDKDGWLVNLEGLRVQGYPADMTGAISGPLGDLQVADATSPPNPTSTITLKANLQADATVPAAWDPANPEATSNFSTPVTVYDSLGNAHAVDVYFRKTAAGAWEWHALEGGGTQIANGTLTFDTDGKLSAMTQTSNFTPAGATSPQPLTFNFGTPTASGGTGLDGVTQFSGASAATFLNQDGFGAGELANVQINANGDVVGAFTNGQTRVLGQVALAHFTAADQLRREGGNLLSETDGSGQPTLGAPGEGGRGALVAGALEQSNVDMATEFVRMIAAQRGFQANSKTITTADALLAELMQLKR